MLTYVCMYACMYAYRFLISITLPRYSMHHRPSPSYFKPTKPCYPDRLHMHIHTYIHTYILYTYCMYALLSRDISILTYRKARLRWLKWCLCLRHSKPAVPLRNSKPMPTPPAWRTSPGYTQPTGPHTVHTCIQTIH